MKSLFARLWLSYLLVVSVTLIGAAGIALGVAVKRGETVDQLTPDSFAQAARIALAEGGHDGLLRWIVGERHMHPELQIYFVDPWGREAMNRQISGRRLQGPGGRLEPLIKVEKRTTYRMVVRRTQNIALTLGDFLSAPEVLLGLVLVVSGLGCALLARFLTQPIQQLRSGVRTIAAGDMKTRLAPTLLRRRDELGSLARDFEKMILNLEDMIASKEELLRDVSHELRSPLARLRLAASLARKEGTPASEIEFERIEREVERIDRMIGEILRFSRMSEGSPPLGFDTIDLTALLEQTLEDGRIEAGAAQKRLRSTILSQAAVRGDAATLRSALENVLRNAIRFTPDGGQIEIDLETIGEKAVIKIIDGGPGIAEQDAENIFRPFFRGEKSNGAGLGLAIARRAILIHGGVIRAANQQDAGLVVQIELPLVHASEVLRENLTHCAEGRLAGHS